MAADEAEQERLAAVEAAAAEAARKAAQERQAARIAESHGSCVADRRFYALLRHIDQGPVLGEIGQEVVQVILNQ